MSKYPAKRLSGLQSYPKLPETHKGRALWVSGPVEVMDWASSLTAAQRGEVFAAAYLAQQGGAAEGDAVSVSHETGTLLMRVVQTKPKRGRPKKVVESGTVGATVQNQVKAAKSSKAKEGKPSKAARKGDAVQPKVSKSKRVIG